MRTFPNWILWLMLAGALAVVPAARGEDDEPASYRLSPRDVIEIKVYRQPDLETRARISEKGIITMPLLGAIKLGGKTVAEARAIIQDSLAADYLVDPQVSVAVLEYAKRLFTVMGEVQRPGSYEMPPQETVNVLQGIAMAGGYTRLGSPGKVTVQRYEGGQKKVYRVDANAIAANERVEPFVLRPGDTVTVGERFF